MRDLVRLAVEGDPDARHLVREAGRRIGEALAAAVNLLNPEAVVVGGDLAAGLRHLRGRAARVGLRPRLGAGHPRAADRPGHPRRASGVVGCAAMAIREVLDSVAVDRALATRA